MNWNNISRISSKFRNNVVFKKLRDFYVKHELLQHKFERIFFTRGFGGDESVSGSGSSLSVTQNIRTFLTEVIKKYEIGSILDAPCGDLNWIHTLDLKIPYIGVDIVRPLIAENKLKYASRDMKFMVKNIVNDPLPKSDLILCRDCFIHLSEKNVIRCLKNLKESGSKYLITNTYPISKNEALGSKRFRQLNMNIEPFNFPEPIEKIAEQEGNKFACLWKLEDLLP